MNATVAWSDLVPERDGIKSPINDIAISPDGTRVIVAAGNRVLFYNAETGDLLDSLRGHKETVLTVDFSHDGTRFASGGADETVVIWKISGQGLLKYTHQSAINRVKYSPNAIKLASCSETDFGIWSPEQSKVVKEKLSSRIVSCAWTLDGNALALGTVTGMVSIRNQNAEEISRVERKAPVWCLLFVPGASITSKTTTTSSKPVAESDVLICGCWGKTLSFYKNQGGTFKLHNEKNLAFYPCAISMLGSSNSKSSFLLLSGSNKKAVMYSKDGIQLSDVIKKDSWIWGCASSHDGERVIVGSNNGAIDCMTMQFVSVHALYRDRYAYRENLTEIIVHHLVQDRKVRIKCKDLIRHLSLYKNKLAVHLTEKVCIYESNSDDSTDMHFRVRKERMSLRPTSEFPGCDHMVIASCNLLFGTKEVIEMYSFDGQRQRVWIMDAPVTFIKVDGGPEGKEGLIVGLESGAIKRIYLQTPFPIELTRLKSAIVSADLNLDRTLISTVDSAGLLSVYDLKTQELFFSAQGVLSVCFNTEVTNMICYSSEKSIYVVAGLGTRTVKEDGSSTIAPIEPQEQYIHGQAIGFQGQRIYCLCRGVITSIDVPQGQYLMKSLDSGETKAAYAIACIGATESDWRLLAIRALRSNAIEVAKKSFSRLKDMKFLNFIEQLERNVAAPTSSEAKPVKSGRNAPIATTVTSAQLNSLEKGWNAELLAYEGHHTEAAKTYARIGKVDEAIRLLTDLRLWEDAKMFSRNAGKTDVSALSLKQAQWLQETNDWKGSSALFISLGNYLQAAKVIAEAGDTQNDWSKAMADVVRSCPADNVEALQFCGEFFTNSSEDVLAKETFLKLGDISRLMQLYAKRQLWTEAAKLADEHEGKFDASVFLPYAEWLVSKDRFEDAMTAYKKANRKDLAQKLLQELTKNAVTERRFKDAAYFYWLLSKETENDQSSQQSQYELEADLYYAYASMHAFVTDPFTSQQPEMLFQVARFILNSLGSAEATPLGISKASTLYTLGKQSMLLGAFKLARMVFDRLTKLKLSIKHQEEIELDMLVVQAKPVRDNDELLPVCYRCGSTNPLLNPFTSKFAKGDVCTNCGHPFVRSFINFDILPLVEFVPEPSISDEEAIELIRQSKGSKKSPKSRDDGWKEGKDGDADVIRFDGNDEDEEPVHSIGVDKFTRCLNLTLDKQNNNYVPVMVDAATLLSIQRSEIFVCRPSSKNKRATFYKNMLPEISIAISQPCHRFFHLEDFEFAYLSNKGCPYSRMKSVGEYGSL